MTNFSDQFNDYSWIKVKRYSYDRSVSLKDNYANLEDHHTKETTFLIEKVRELAKMIDEKEKENA